MSFQKNESFTVGGQGRDTDNINEIFFVMAKLIKLKDENELCKMFLDAILCLEFLLFSFSLLWVEGCGGIKLFLIQEGEPLPLEKGREMKLLKI
jgi:hypothetical protein